ncbi:MAG: hypothetical protein AAF705_15000, partial [Bacteroidota bacterium]
RSKKSEFAIVYGRRRVGKTFLVSRKFEKDLCFRMTALANANTAAQLQNFYNYLQTFSSSEAGEMPLNWLSAFQLLIAYLEQHPAKRKVIFLDELPWFNTHGSDFLSGLEHFWNGWAAYRSDILLITCGSAASGMINNLLRDKGGLHNRVTERISVQPFNLKETEQFLQAKGAVYDRYQLLELYMAVGGIPFYLENIRVDKSVAQNIDLLFFSPGGLLQTEYSNLYRSLFTNHERHLSVVEVLAKKTMGLSRKELVKQSGLKEGGNFSTVLKELEESGFISRYYPFGKSNRDARYRLSDPYTLFYLSFVRNTRTRGSGAWLSRMGDAKWRAWSGYAFEQICLYHIPQLKAALGISGVYTEASIWRSKQKKEGAQIDLLLDRNDRVINICEIKFSIAPYIITKDYAEKLQRKLYVFREETRTRKTLFLTMITTYGLKENAYASQRIQNSIDMNALFK